MFKRRISREEKIGNVGERKPIARMMFFSGRESMKSSELMEYFVP